MAAVALVVVLGGVWLIVQTVQLQTQLERLQAEQRDWQQRAQDLQRQLAQQQAHRDELAQQLERERAERERLEQDLAAQSPSRPGIVSFLLFPLSRFRSEAEEIECSDQRPTGAA